MSVTQKTKETIDTTKLVWKNLVEFITATSLTSVSVFAIITSYLNRHENNWYYALFFAGTVQILIAFGLLVKHFSKR